MRIKTGLVAAAAALATLLTPLAAGPAAAAGQITEATVEDPAFYGRVVLGWRYDGIDPILITAQDRKTDGFAIGIRLVINDGNGQLRVIPSGKASAEWRTYLRQSNVYSVYFRVCKIRVANDNIEDCYSSRVMENPIQAG
ncbi:hypothetical protein ACN20G_15420 [Streptomyces sp. BI20]|uniref:hypothetical protein n=1 Tax=Streptomyces sp. BI20 TaxID=3403460 RepID=UPI003C748D7C